MDIRRGTICIDQKMINEIFNLNDYSSMYLGASVFDVHNFYITKDDLDNLYDTLNRIPRKHFPDVFASTLWLTGTKNFETEWRTLLSNNEQCYTVTHPRGLIHTSEFIGKREYIPFILSHFRWQGKNKIYRGKCQSNNLYYDHGILNKAWAFSPLSIKYYVKMKGNGNTPDYLYLLGGNEKLFKEDGFRHHQTALYGLYMYLTFAKNKLSFDHVFEKDGKSEKKVCIEYVSDEIREQLNGF